MTLRPAVGPAAVLSLAWILFSVPDGLHGLEFLAGLAAAFIGALAGALWEPVHDVARKALHLADDLLGEGGTETAPDWSGRVEAGPANPDVHGDGDGDAALLDHDAAPAGLDAFLARMERMLGASRVLVWTVDVDADLVAPEHGSPPLPATSAAKGNPLAWAVREGSPLRLEPAPRWARGRAVVVPVDAGRVMTAEFDRTHDAADRPVDEATLMDAASLLAPFLRLHDQQVHAVAATRRLDRVVEFLGSVPSEADPAHMPHALAASALRIIGGSGALVAAWRPEEGRVVTRTGDGGGPAVGEVFTALDGDLAHAARTRATVRRAPGDGPDHALASPTENWARSMPAYRTVIPLVDPLDQATGVLAVWGTTSPAEQGIALLQAIAPLLALQLSQADDLERFRARADVDALTGLPNRSALEDRMEEERARFHRYRRPLSLLVIDLDHFKRINDTHGHEAGDAVLRRVADVLRSVIRDVDFAARFGGEELVVLLPETMLTAALDAGERVRAAVAAAPIEYDGGTIPVTASVGVSSCPDCVADPEALFTSADSALYASKEGGRNRVTAAPGGVASGGAGG